MTLQGMPDVDDLLIRRHHAIGAKQCSVDLTPGGRPPLLEDRLGRGTVDLAELFGGIVEPLVAGQHVVEANKSPEGVLGRLSEKGWEPAQRRPRGTAGAEAFESLEVILGSEWTFVEGEVHDEFPVRSVIAECSVRQIRGVAYVPEHHRDIAPQAVPDERIRALQLPRRERQHAHHQFTHQRPSSGRVIDAVGRPEDGRRIHPGQRDGYRGVVGIATDTE